MSSRHLLILMALASIAIFPAIAAPPAGDAIADLLIADNIQKVEELLQTAPASPENTAYQGEVEFRKGHFDKAETLYRAALAANSRTARAQFGLGKLAMARLRVKEALTRFDAAIAADPGEALYHFYASEAADLDKNDTERLRHLQQYVQLMPNDEDRLAEAKAGLEVLKAFQGTAVATIEAPQEPEPIPFTKALNLIFANVMVNGQGPFRFFIDTGASQVVLSQKVASQLALKPLASTIMFGVGGAGKVETQIYRLNQIDIGSIKIRNFPVGTFDDPLISQIADGIIGTSMLSDFVITIDYPKSQMELTHKKPSGSEALPAWYFANLLMVPFDANGHPGNFLVDTGAVTTVLAQSMAATLGVTESTPGAKVDLGVFGVAGGGAALMVHDVTFKTTGHAESIPQLMAIDMKEVSRMIQTEVSGVIGYDILKDYRLTLDYANAEIRLTK